MRREFKSRQPDNVRPGDPGGFVLMLLVGLLLHGICYDFFSAWDRLRSSAQVTLATYGVEILIGSLVSGPIVYFASS